MKRIAVVSGKGGVGKSTITSSLGYLLSKRMKVAAVDCDVDTPNLAFFFGLGEDDFEKKVVSTSETAKIDYAKCTGCGKCKDVCLFSAIEWKDRPIVNRFLCEGCGRCALVCPEGAIRIERVRNGWIGRAEGRFPLFGGQMKMGEAGSGTVIFELRKMADEGAEKAGAELLLIDAPAGIGCATIAALRGADFVIGVAEPSPSSLADLKRVLQIVKHFRIPYGLVINKGSLNREWRDKIVEFAKEDGMAILGELPYDRAFVDSLVQMKTVVEYKEELRGPFEKIITALAL